MLCTFEHALQASNPDPPAHPAPDPPAHLRGAITSFSASSRRRLLRLLSTVQTSRLPPARFVTLTFHRPPEDWHACALAFRQWMRRQNALYIWRLEAQERGAPHYHLIIWCEHWNSAEAESTWHRIAANGSTAHAEYGYDEQPLETYAQAFAYAAKYCAKRDRDLPEGLRNHRIWGASRALPCSSTGASDQLSSADFYALRRFARRLLHARARAKGRYRTRRSVSPRAFHLYLRAGDAERIAAWLGVDLIDPLWTTAHANTLAQQFGSTNPANAPPVWWHRGQSDAFGPGGARLN